MILDQNDTVSLVQTSQLEISPICMRNDESTSTMEDVFPMKDHKDPQIIKEVRFHAYDEVMQIPSSDEPINKGEIWYSREDLLEMKRECCMRVDLARQKPEIFECLPEMHGLHKFLDDHKTLLQQVQGESIEVVLDLQYVYRSQGNVWQDPTAEDQMSKLYSRVCEDATVYALDSGLLLEYELFGDDEKYSNPYKEMILSSCDVAEPNGEDNSMMSVDNESS
jgi:hypothetical protein